MGTPPEKNALLPQQGVGEEHKVLLSQFKHSLKSPKRFHQLLDSLGSWLCSKPGTYSKQDIHRIKRSFKTVHSFYVRSPAAARPSVLHLLHSWFILCLQNPSVFLDFVSQFVKEGSQPHGAEQAGQARPGEPAQSPQRVSREHQRAHEPLEETFKRLHRKYGRDRFMIAAHQVDEAAQGIQYQAIAKNVPVKYITIGKAAEEFQIANDTLAEWVADGLLHNVTKVEHPANPETGIVLVEPREVMKLKEKVGVGEEAAEPTLISLPDAARKYDVPYTTVRAWYQRGHLQEKGREVFGTHGGGKILVAEKDVVRLTNRRTSQRNHQTKRTE